MNIAFVVLHYLAVKDTLECVESIRKNIDTEDYKIIVVDNASPDDSFSVLCTQYHNDENVVLMHNENNLGFAKGNNVGFRYAKETLRAKFIVLLNNDVCLFQKNLYKIIERKYKAYTFAVLGPMILTKDGRYTQNPTRWQLFDRAQCENTIKTLTPLLDQFVTESKLGAFRRKVLGKCKRIPNRVLREMKIIKNISVDVPRARWFQDCTQVVLHGSFLVFSEQYIKDHDGLYDKTFMYFEEDILQLLLLQENKLSLYTPDISIYHKEDVSTNAMLDSRKKQDQFRWKHQIESIRLYMELYDRYETKKL